MNLKWQEEYSVGVAVIDNQHKQLVSTIASMAFLLGKSHNVQKIANIFEELEQYAAVHFKTEEELFAKYNYEFAAEHIAKHNEFEAKIVELKVGFKNDSILGSFDLTDYLEDWLLNHLLTEDRKYIPYMKQHNIK
ncbi:MAG: bacteriohemerythrin [bacterium]